MPEREIIAFSSEPLVGTLLGIAGIVMAIYFYFKSRQFSRLALQTHEIAVIGGRTSAFDDHLEIRFGGEIVDRVTMTRSVLWNAGNVTIEGNKIVSSDPLRFQVNSENKILKIDIILQTRSVNDINFKRVDQNILLVDFDFIDPKDGITVEITHSGTIGEIKLLGTIRGIPNILSTIGTDESFIRVMQNLPKNFEKFSLMLTAGIGIFMVIIGLFNEWFKPLIEFLDKPIIEGTGPSWPIVTVGCIYASIPLSIMWMRRRKFPVSLDIRKKDSTFEKSMASVFARIFFG